jgi:uncharacterized protein
MLRRIVVAFCCCAPLLGPACASGPTGAGDSPKIAVNATPQQQAAGAQTTAQAQVVTVTAEEVRLAAGGSAESTVRLRIADGYHVNANPPSDKFYVGTEIRAEPQGGIKPGKAIYPPGESKKFQFSEAPLSVYEGETVIRLPLTAAADTAKGRQSFAARIRVQPCNDEACLPPRDIDTSIPVIIE